MADYSNPRLPEGINNSERHPLRELLWLGGGAVVIVLAIVLGLGLLAQWLAPKIPFAYEADLARPLVATLKPADAKPRACIETYLQDLAERLAAAQALPPDMSVTVHYVDADTVNAAATLGGHLLMYRGLIEKLPHENALATVLSHEIAHVHHRHAITALGRGVTVGVALAALSGVSSSALSDWVVGDPAPLTHLAFSRTQEPPPHATGLGAVAALYGHTGGAADLYRVLLQEAEDRGMGAGPAFFRTHPNTEGRIDAIGALSRSNGWPAAGDLTPLPTWLADALAQDGGCPAAD
ncbi:MAG: M48 family metallopeptidase [Thiohalocapsa sp.]|nr:M48 family metallopeptidase [Thiohalocapsa sp.]